MGLALSVDTFFCDGPLGVGILLSLLGVHVELSGLCSLVISDPPRSVLGNSDFIHLTLIVHDNNKSFLQLTLDVRWDLLLLLTVLLAIANSGDFVVESSDNQFLGGFSIDFDTVFKIKSGTVLVDTFDP